MKKTGSLFQRLPHLPLFFPTAKRIVTARVCAMKLNGRIDLLSSAWYVICKATKMQETVEKERWSKIRRNVCLYVLVVDRVSGKLSSKLYGVVTLKESSTGRVSLSFWLKWTCQVHVEEKKRGTWLKCPHLLLNEKLFKKSYGWYQRSKVFFLQTDHNEKLNSNLLFVFQSKVEPYLKIGYADSSITLWELPTKAFFTYCWKPHLYTWPAHLCH